MKTLVAFDKFKGALSAREANKVAAKTLSALGHETIEIPLTDGGEGFVESLNQLLNGEAASCQVSDPLFRPTQAKVSWVDLKDLTSDLKEALRLPADLTGNLAILEMSQASGYELLAENERNAWNTSTFGTGEMIKWACEEGAQAILLGIGGSATNDCGAGALEALGVCFYDITLQPVEKITPSTWKTITTLGGTLHVGDQFPLIRIACDVDNPLCGPNGATAVFGPQKGIPSEDIERLDRNMDKMGRRLLGLFGKDPETWDDWLKIKGSGAAGGIGFGLKAALPDVEFVPGAALFHLVSKIDDRLQEVDCLITGEGSFDQSSLNGKGPHELLKLANPNIKKVLLAGRIDPVTEKTLKDALQNLETMELMEEGWDSETSIKNTSAQIQKRLKALFS